MYRGLTVRAWPKTSAAMLQDLQLGLVENEGEYIYIYIYRAINPSHPRNIYERASGNFHPLSFPLKRRLTVFLPVCSTNRRISHLRRGDFEITA